jgi:trk system potassium uptake protein TrkA
MRYIAVLGIGRFGYSVAKTLSEMGCQVLAIDKDPSKIAQLEDVVTQAVQLNATDEKALKAIGIKDVDVAVVSIGANMEASILASLILKEMGVPCVVSKAITPQHGRVLEKIGCDRVVYPEGDMGTRVARSLVSPTIVDELELSPGYGIYEVQVPPFLGGKTLSQHQFRSRYSLNVVAIKDSTEGIMIFPGGDALLEEGQILVLLGKKEDLNRFEKAVKKWDKER